MVGLGESRIDSNYHGLTLQVNRRFNRGFSFQAAYTFGNAKDYPGVAEEVTDLGTRLRQRELRHPAQAGAERHLPDSRTSRRTRGCATPSAVGS